MRTEEQREKSTEGTGRRSLDRFEYWSCVVRWSVGIPLIIAGTFLLTFHGPGIGLLGPFLGMLGGILIANEIAHILSRPAGSILWRHQIGKKQPMYGIPESLAAKGDYAGAEAEYEKIIEEYPKEVKPHIDMINIAVMRLHDGKLADQLYKRGMALLKDPTSRETLSSVYSGIRSRLK